MPTTTRASTQGEGRRPRILILSEDPIRQKMAGPAIRCWHMALELSRECDVRLVSWKSIERRSDDFTLAYVAADDNATMIQHEDWMDVVIVQGVGFRQFESIRHTQKVVVADLYDPFHLEQLEHKKHLPAGQWRDEVRKAVSLLDEQIARADLFLCASERQRDLWIGSLSALGRVNPLNYSADPTLGSLVRIVPFGLPDSPPIQTRHAIKGTVPGIDPSDKVLIWGGGIYEWFDPITLIDAMGILAPTHPEVKLYFLSAQHFNQEIADMNIVGQTRDRSARLGLTDKSVFFNSSWVDYDDRANYLMDADLGVSTHHLHAETRFSFRTRILDYLWAGLPVVTTEGDTFAELVERRGLGAVVPAGDPEALAAAIIATLSPPATASAAEAVAAVRPTLAWSQALSPLRDFCADPRRAADHTDLPRTASFGRGGFDRILSMPRGRARDLRLFVYYLREGGPALLLSKIRERRGRFAREGSVGN